MSRLLAAADGPAFLALMKRYVVDYTNAHDQSVTGEIMEPDYRLRMGDHYVVGRDGAYGQATRKQMDQFPDLGLTVHEIWTSGERLAMRFSEHGASLRHGGNRAAWGGIGLYHWNGERLTTNMVEQDYFARAAQLAEGRAHPVEAPALAPWKGVAAIPNRAVEQATRSWLEAGSLESTEGVFCDDAWLLGAGPQLIEQDRVAINDLFSCGSVAAFHATQYGTLREPIGSLRSGHGPVQLHMAGIVHVEGGEVARGRVIRNRLDLARSGRQAA
jgi:hypothetical protein